MGVITAPVDAKGHAIKMTELYERWAGQSPSPHLGTNFGSDRLPFMDWYRFKEAFSPAIVHKAITSHNRDVEHCIDPFGGSGTTALVCQILGVPSTSIEVNPFLHDLAVAKTTCYQSQDIDELAESLRRSEFNSPASPTIQPLAWTPTTFVEPGVNGRFIFSREIAEKIQSLLDFRDSIEDESLRKLFSVCLGSCLVPNSNVLINGKGRRYRRSWQSIRHSPSKLLADLINKIVSVGRDLRQFQTRQPGITSILVGDSRQNSVSLPKFDVSVFSPPYPNSFDYTDIYNIELWTLGYLKSSDANRLLRQQTLCSHLQIGRDFQSPTNSSKTLHETVEKLLEVRNNLWDRRIPAMVQSYFGDLEAVLSNLNSAKKVGARIWAVVGNSQYHGIEINTPQILAELAESMGLDQISSAASRMMRNSPQQGGATRLAETVLILG